jgi:hypothetical protein
MEQYVRVTVSDQVAIMRNGQTAQPQGASFAQPMCVVPDSDSHLSLKVNPPPGRRRSLAGLLGWLSHAGGRANDWA